MTANENEPDRDSDGEKKPEAPTINAELTVDKNGDGEKTGKPSLDVELAWGKWWWKGKGLGAIAILAFVGLIGFVVMFLWNSTIAVIFDLGEIGYWQALGLFLLAKLFFGFGGGGQRGRGRWRSRKHRGHELGRLARREDFKKFWDQEGKQAYTDYLSRQESDAGQSDH